MRNISISIILLLVATASVFAQNLSSKEKKILKQVAINNADALKFLEETVNINSGTMNADGVREVGKLFDAKFKAIGFETSWIDMPAEMDRAGHFFAEHKGSKGKRLLLIGHLDTVFEKDSPFQKYVQDGDKATGPGVEDMKGGDIIILYALKALHEAGYLKNTQIIVALHGDEEESGKPISVSRKDIIEAAKRSDIALGYEASSGFNEATLARRGSSGWELSVTGKRSHSADIFSDEVGAGAIFEASRILIEWYNTLKDEKYLTFNPGIITGGTFAEYNKNKASATAFGKANVVPQTVHVAGGLRFISEEQKANARKKMQEIVDNHLPKTEATFTYWDSYPAMEPTKGNEDVMEILSQVSQDLGNPPVIAYDPMKRGAADISFVAKYTDGLDGLGSMGGGGHTPQEWIDLTTFEDLTRRTAILIYRLTR
jgi:glutamate carboxypeptidase